MSKRASLSVFVGVLVLVGTSAFAQNPAPKIGLSLHASVEAIAPAEPFELGLKFDLPDEYHIYWENPGDRGVAPRVEWGLPPGFTAGPLRFPAPRRHVAGGLVTNVLRGSPVLLTTVTPPADLNVGTPITFQADVRWLVNKETAFEGARKVAITVPTAAQSKPASEDQDGLLFTIARRALPVPVNKARFITVEPGLAKSTVGEGDRFEVTLDVTIKKGYHTQSNKPLGEFFIPTAVFLKKVEGLTFAHPVWPPAHIRTDKVLGRISEFTGSFQARIPVAVEEPTLTEEVTVAGLLTYQACNDKGHCYPPESVEWSVNLTSEFVGEALAPVAREPAVAGIAEAPDQPAPLLSAPGAGTEPAAAEQGGLSGLLLRAGLIGAIIGGFLGGLILNIMPCVLPVISIKVLSFVQQADEEPKRVFQLGLAFAAGIVVSFLVLALGILWLQHETQSIRGWGTFFQEPRFVVAMIVVMFVFALNLFGVFEIILPGAATTRLASATEGEGFSGAFLKGVLATLLATPCTAPFLASAVSFALASSTAVVLLIFTSAGVGMASPYVILTAKPAWMRYLPRPGAWMVTFKQFMGFLLIGTVVWLLWILGALVGDSGVVWAVGFLAFAGLGCWLFGRVQFGRPTAGKFVACAIALGIVLIGGWFSYGMYEPQQIVAAYASIEEVVSAADWESQKGSATPKIPWVPYQKGLAEKLSARGYTVYVDYTATWCFTCQANKKVALGNDAVVAKMAELHVIPIKADNTSYNADIAEDLRRFKHDAVPLNLVYPPGKPEEPIVLPVILTPGTVLEALTKAGPSVARRASATSADE